MSLWLRTRDGHEKRYYVLVPVHLLWMAAWFLAAVLAFVLPAAGLLKSIPAQVSFPALLAAAAVMLVGLVCFALAKLSVIRGGRLISFGSWYMSREMRVAYRVGYILIVIGGAASILFSLLV